MWKKILFLAVVFLATNFLYAQGNPQDKAVQIKAQTLIKRIEAIAKSPLKPKSDDELMGLAWGTMMETSDLRKIAPKVMPEIISAIQDKNRDYRMRFVILDGVLEEIEDLQILKNQSLIGSLIKIVLDKKDNLIVRLSASDVLRKIELNKVIKPLFELAFDKNEDIQLRIDVLYIFLKANLDKNDIDNLLTLFQDKSEAWDFRRSIAIFLGGNIENMANQDKVKPYIGTLEDFFKGKDPDLRRFAICALGYIRDERVIHLLIMALEDSDAGVRTEAISALSDINTPNVTEALGRHAAENGSIYAIEMLGRRKDKLAVPYLIEALKYKGDELVRDFAATALANIGAKEAIPQLEEALKSSESASVRDTIRAALYRLDPKKYPLKYEAQPQIKYEEE